MTTIFWPSTLIFIQTTFNNYLSIYLQRLHPSIQKPVKQVKDKSLSENDSQPDSKKLQKQNCLWNTNMNNGEKNKIKAKVFL